MIPLIIDHLPPSCAVGIESQTARGTQRGLFLDVQGVSSQMRSATEEVTAFPWGNDKGVQHIHTQMCMIKCIYVFIFLKTCICPSVYIYIYSYFWKHICIYHILYMYEYLSLDIYPNKTGSVGMELVPQSKGRDQTEGPWLPRVHQAIQDAMGQDQPYGKLTSKQARRCSVPAGEFHQGTTRKEELIDCMNLMDTH